MAVKKIIKEKQLCKNMFKKFKKISYTLPFKVWNLWKKRVSQFQLISFNFSAKNISEIVSCLYLDYGV